MQGKSKLASLRCQIPGYHAQFRVCLLYLPVTDKQGMIIPKYTPKIIWMANILLPVSDMWHYCSPLIDNKVSFPTNIVTFFVPASLLAGFPSGLVLSKEFTCQCRRHRFSPWAGKIAMSLEKEMATHSSVLVWVIPWTAEPAKLQSMWSQELDTT